MPQFIHGLELARALHQEALRPILVRRYPRLRYSAALIGSGSEVLGYDDAMSTDHHWGPRLLLFLSERDYKACAAPLAQALGQELPYTFMDYPTNFSAPKTGGGDQGTHLLEPIDTGPINHRIEIFTLDGFMRAYLGIGLDTELTATDWLSLPQQKLLGFTSGAVFHDELALQAIRARLRFYPDAVWRYLLLCGWQRIGQDEHLAPRAGFVGDELGAALIAGRLVRSIMQLCFLMERRYAPYPKWFGTAFAELDCASELSPILRAIQSAGDFRDRERHLCAAYALLNRRHNALQLTPEIAPAVAPFHERGFLVSNAWRYCEALADSITDKAVKQIAAKWLIGSIDQFSDNTDLREAARQDIARLYGG